MEQKFKKLTGVLPLEIAEIGDYVQFGKIAWKVIGIEDGKKLLLSKEWMYKDTDEELEENSLEELLKEIAEDHGEEDDIEQDDMDDEWEDDLIDEELANTCSAETFNKKYRACSREYEGIQKYLREEFCKEYLSQDDIKRIVPYSIKTEYQINSEYIFLLSRYEVEKYIPQKEDRIATAVNHIFDVKKPWLLRFNDEERYYFYVDTKGEIVFGETDRYTDKFRPAVWVK